MTLGRTTVTCAAAGDAVLAANAILLQLILFSAFVLDGVSFAAEALCGEAYGANNKARLSLTIKYCFIWSSSAGFLFAVAYVLFGQQLIGLFTDLDSVLQTATHYLPWLVLVTAIGFAAYLMDGICIGLARSAAMHFCMWLSVIVFLAAWYLSIAMGNHGLWLAYAAWVFARGGLLGTNFYLWQKQYFAQL